MGTSFKGKRIAYKNQNNNNNTADAIFATPVIRRKFLFNINYTENFPRKIPPFIKVEIFIF